MLASAGMWSGSSTNCVASTDLGTASTLGVMVGAAVTMSGGEEQAGGTDDMERETGQGAKDKGNAIA